MQKKLTRFIRLAGKSEDTPCLIQRIAENGEYMRFCSAAVKGQSSSASELFGLYQSLRKEAMREGFLWDRLTEKLTPVAIVLGLYASDAEQANYYQRLGVPSDAEPDHIKKAYREKARQTHPDMVSGPNNSFLSIHEAYEVLSDPAQREQYDLSRKQIFNPGWAEDVELSVSKNKNGNPVQEALRQYGYPLAAILMFLIFVAIAADALIQQRSLNEGFSVATKKLEPEKSKSIAGGGEKGILRTEPIDKKSEEMATSRKDDVSDEDIADIPSVPVLEPLIKAKSPIKEEKKVISKQVNQEIVHQPEPKQPAMAQGKELLAAGEKSKESSRKVGATPMDLTKALNIFLSRYCRAYEDMDLSRFMSFFSKNAKENGTAIKELIPTYQRNFKNIAAIKYNIEMGDYMWDLDLDRIQLEGNFVLKWMKKGFGQWHRYSGSIHMVLIRTKNSFRVQRLNYRFSH